MSDLHNAKKYAVRRKRHSIWRNIVTCIAAVVVFCTTYALILPAITMEYSCGKEEHVHAEGCYKLTCGLEQTPGHFHDETCYDEEGKLICEQEEPQSHAHTEECYAPADPTVPTDPICGLEETTGHTHDAVTCYALPKTLTCGQEEVAAHAHDPASCYTEQTSITCGQEESAGHTHTDACYTQQTSIICGLEESAEHTHTDACRSVTSVLACGQEESAGHIHSDACYTTSSVLTCTLAETGGHTHTDACYTVGDIPELVCTQEEAPGHTHTDACYPAASQPQLICGKEEVEVHKHTDECYTLVCVLEEHTHTNECQVKDEEPTETTAPTDASEPIETTAPTDASDPAETTAPTDASDPGETTAPTDAILEETNILAAAAVAPRAARGPFFNYIHNPNAGTTIYDSENKIYSTKIDFDFSVTGAQLKQTNGEFFILVSDKVSVPAYGEHFKIKNRDNEETGEFWFERDETTGRAKMIINFDKDKVAALQPDQEISGNMYFEGKVDKSAMQDDGHLKFELTEGVPIEVSNDKINSDNKEINKYDLSVAKSAGEPVATPGEGDTLGKATVHYDVEVTTTKGTPGVIDINDSLGWTSGNPAACEMKNITVKKVSTTTGETTQEVTPTITDKNWSMQLPKLEAGEKYVVSYDYEYTFANGDTTMVKSVSNTVHATSKVPGGRPEEKVDGEDTETVEKIIPPSPDPSLDKSGTEDKANQKIDWKVTFNEDRKTFGGNGDIELTDTMLDQAMNGSLHVTADGNPLTLDTHYKVENGKLILLNPAQSTAKIEITYSTPSSALNQWTSGTALNKVENKVSYQGKFNTVETTAKLEKEGGGVSKSGGTPVKGDGKLTIPWKVTITPGSNGIPAGKTFTDAVDIGEFSQKIDAGSVKVYYADASGNPITDASGNPIEVGGLSVPLYQDDDYNGGKHKLTFTFDQNPFEGNVAPAGAKKVVVSYNTTAKVPDRDYTFNNDVNVDEKKDHDFVPYKNIWVFPKKSGTLTEMGDHLDIKWNVSFNSNEEVITSITDTLKAAGYGEHHYSTVPDTLKIMRWGATLAELHKGTDYTVTYYDAAGNEVTDLSSGKAVSMKINFTQDGGYVFPQYDKDKGCEVAFEYTTSTDSIPDISTEYHNSAIAFDREAEADVPWDPGDLEKTHSEHVVDSEKGTVTIPWTVKVTSKSGKITTPITDSLENKKGTFTHYFPENPKLKITVLDKDGKSLGDLGPTQYTVEYFGDYSGKAEAGNGVPAAEGKGNTYMVIKLLPEGEFVIPNGAKTLQLTYETVASPIPEGVETFDNTAWALGKKDTDQDKIEPSKPTPTDKTAGRVELSGVGVRIPWTATIKRGVVPLATLEEGTWYDQYNKGDYARHYFDLSTISFEYLDAAGNVLAVGQETEGEPSALPTYDVTCYNDCWNNNGLLATDDSKLCKPGDPARFIRLNFHEGDAFKHAPEGTESLRMHYYTYNNNVTAEESVNFKNNVQVSGQYKDASTSITKVEKTAMDANWSWTKDPVNVGETDGTLKQWRIRATTSGKRTFLTFTDILPEYVKLENVELKYGKDQWSVGTPLGSFDAATGKFTGPAAWDGTTVDGSCVKNEDGRYVLTITVKAKEGTPFDPGYVFDVTLTPKVDVASLPASLQGKQFSLTNQATVTHDEGSAPSNPSTQIWTDSRPDVADGSLAKGKFPLDGGGRLNYVVTVNREGKDLEPDGNSFVLIDTLTYNGTEFTVDPVYQTSPKDALKGYEMRLDTSDKHMLRLYKADAEGRLEANDKGEIVHGTLLDSSEWAMTVDTKTRADGTTEKIIRVTVPDGTPLLMLYSYNVELRTDPVTADVSNLHFSYSAQNTVKMYGHKKVEATDEKTQETWQSSSGGGTTKTDYNTFTLKKVDAANNALLLSGAEFKVQAYTGGAWTDVQRDPADPEKKFVTDGKGVLTIQSDEAWMQDNVLYRAYETKAPDGYVLPDSPMSFYFYRSGENGTPLDAALTRGATDLAAGSNLLWVENTSAKAGIKLEKIWKDSQGNTIAGTANQDFELIQYRSATKPETSGGGDNPMLSTRNLKINVKDNGGNSHYFTYDTTKGTMMQLTVTHNNPNNYWATISDSYAVFKPAIPEIRRQVIYDPNNQNNVKALVFTFPVTTVEEAEIQFNSSWNDLNVTLVPLGRSAAAAAALGVVGEGDTLEQVRSWPITLSPGNGYKWSSDGFDIDPDQPGVQLLPFTQKDADGKTWYYTYVVKEVNASAAYTVSYSNMQGDELVSMSSGTIRVTNTRLENPPISLPNTGGIGTTVFTLAGLALTGGAGLGLCKTKAKRKRGMFEKE